MLTLLSLISRNTHDNFIYFFAASRAEFLSQLDSEVMSAKAQAFAHGTSANLKTQWRAYLLFCSFLHLTPVPSSIRTACRYIMFLANSLKSYTSLKNYINGVRVFHLCNGVAFEWLTNFEVRLILQSVRRKLSDTPFAKLPIEPWILRRMYPLLNFACSEDATLWCSFLVAFFAFLRKSNVVPPSQRAFNPLRHLSRHNITRTSYGLLLKLQLTKTIQFKQRILQIPIAAIPGSILDPVAAFDRMCTLAPAAAHSPAFLYWKDGSLVSLTHSLFTTRLRHLLGVIGLQPHSFSGHSFRRGGLSFGFRANVPIELLKAHGDWRSDAYLRYLTFSPDQQLVVTKSMGQAIRASTP